MTDLEAVQAGRDDALANRFARRIEPTMGFIVYGILWAWVSVGIACATGLILALPIALLIDRASMFVNALAFVGIGIGFVFAWWLYVRWAKRKRARARAVIRDGVLCEATVATGLVDRVASVAAGAHWERVVFEHGGKTYSCIAPFASRPAAGATAHVLFVPGAKYALAFSPAGVAYSTKPSVKT
ncbi:MAG TPA: hypothetical protein VGG28_31360 [Kofleriaceae bacterium]